MIGVIFAAFKGIEILSDDAECGKAGIVVDVFEAFVDDGTALVVKHFHLVACAAHDVHEQIEMPGKHIGDEDGMRRLHGRREHGIRTGEIGRRFLRDILFHDFLPSSSMAASSERRRILTTPRLLISSILIWV